MRSLLALLMLTAVVLPAQEAGKQTAYKLELKIRDSDDQRSSASRNYSFVLDEGARGMVRAGKKVPLGDKGYHDLGVNIDARVRENNGALLAEVELDISSLEGAAIHQLKWKGTSRVPAGKSTVVSSLQDPILQKRLDVEITVTRVP